MAISTKINWQDGDTVYAADLNRIENNIKEMSTSLNGKANSSHTHSASDINSGLIPITRGGTGSASAAAARTALGITPNNIGAAAASHTHKPSDIGAAEASHSHSEIDESVDYLIEEGYVSVDNSGNWRFRKWKSGYVEIHGTGYAVPTPQTWGSFNGCSCEIVVPETLVSTIWQASVSPLGARWGCIVGYIFATGNKIQVHEWALDDSYIEEHSVTYGIPFNVMLRGKLS